MKLEMVLVNNVVWGDKKEQLNSIQVTEEFPKLLKQLNLIKMELYLVVKTVIY
jgi:hypothetical protein